MLEEMFFTFKIGITQTYFDSHQVDVWTWINPSLPNARAQPGAMRVDFTPLLAVEARELLII
jgi:hypothetical protein